MNYQTHRRQYLIELACACLDSGVRIPCLLQEQMESAGINVEAFKERHGVNNFTDTRKNFASMCDE